MFRATAIRPDTWQIAFVAFWLLHLWQCSRCFPNWAAIVDDRPVIVVDHALHLYHGCLGARFLRTHGRNWGYDPFFMAGYPKTPFHDPSSGLADVSQLLSRSDYSPCAYKIVLLFTMATTPVLLAAAARLLGFNSLATFFGVVLATGYYWLDFARPLLDSGLFSFLWGSAWAPVVVGACLRWRQSPNAWNWSLLTCVASVSIFVHPTVSIMLVGPLVAVYISCVAHKSRWWHLQTWAAVTIALVANGFWIVPMVRLWPLRQVQYIFMLDPPDYFLNYYRENALAAIIAALASVGWLHWCRVGERFGATIVGVLITVLCSLAFFGSAFSATQGLEPRRFLVPLHFLLAIAAGQAFVAARGILGTLRGRLLVAGAASLAVGLLWFRQFDRVISVMLFDRRPLAVGLAPPMSELVEWIDKNTDNSARILLEDQLRLLEQTEPESLHWTCLLPILTERQFIGGHYQVTPLLHHHASFGDFSLGRRPLLTYSPAQLAEFLDRYNVGWAICWSSRAKLVFDGFTRATPLAELARYSHRPGEDRYYLYKIARPHSYFAQGSGQVANVDFNRIELTDLRPEGGRIVIRYHWLDTFRARPDVPIERVPAGDDPVGFIGIRTRSNIERLVITNAY